MITQAFELFFLEEETLRKGHLFSVIVEKYLEKSPLFEENIFPFIKDAISKKGFEVAFKSVYHYKINQMIQDAERRLEVIRDERQYNLSNDPKGYAERKGNIFHDVTENHEIEIIENLKKKLLNCDYSKLEDLCTPDFDVAFPDIVLIHSKDKAWNKENYHLYFLSLLLYEEFCHNKRIAEKGAIDDNKYVDSDNLYLAEKLLIKKEKLKIKIYQEKGRKRPHVHIDYDITPHMASYAIDTGEVIEGGLTPKLRKEYQ